MRPRHPRLAPRENSGGEAASWGPALTSSQALGACKAFCPGRRGGAMRAHWEPGAGAGGAGLSQEPAVPAAARPKTEPPPGPLGGFLPANI